MAEYVSEMWKFGGKSWKLSVCYSSGHVAELVYAYASEAYPVRVGSSSLPMPTRNANLCKR